MREKERGGWGRWDREKRRKTTTYKLAYAKIPPNFSLFFHFLFPSGWPMFLRLQLNYANNNNFQNNKKLTKGQVSCELWTHDFLFIYLFRWGCNNWGWTFNFHILVLFFLTPIIIPCFFRLSINNCAWWWCMTGDVT